MSLAVDQARAARKEFPQLVEAFEHMRHERIEILNVLKTSRDFIKGEGWQRNDLLRLLAKFIAELEQET